MSAARSGVVVFVVAAFAVACSGGPGRRAAGGAAGKGVAGQGAAGQGGAGGDGAAGQMSSSGAAGAAGCSPSGDNTIVGCDSAGIVTMVYVCPPRSVRLGSCPHGCKPFGSFGGFDPATDCNPEPGDGGSDGEAGSDGGSAGGGPGGCVPSSDNVVQSCTDGVVTTTVSCPSSKTMGTCPYGCRVAGMFGTFPSICKDAPPDAGCDGACGDASAHVDASPAP